MDTLYQKYIDNLIAAHGLLKPRLKPNMTEEEPVSVLVLVRVRQRKRIRK